MLATSDYVASSRPRAGHRPVSVGTSPEPRDGAFRPRPLGVSPQLRGCPSKRHNALIAGCATSGCQGWASTKAVAACGLLPGLEKAVITALSCWFGPLARVRGRPAFGG